MTVHVYVISFSGDSGITALITASAVALWFVSRAVVNVAHAIVEIARERRLSNSENRQNTPDSLANTRLDVVSTSPPYARSGKFPLRTRARRLVVKALKRNKESG